MPLAWRLFYISYENGRTKVGVRCLCSAALLPFSFVVSGFVAGCCSTQLLVGNKPSLSLPLPLSLCTESSQLCAHKRAILFLDLFPDDVFIFSFTCRRRCVFFFAVDELQFSWFIRQQRPQELQWNHKFIVTMLCEHFWNSLPMCRARTVPRSISMYIVIYYAFTYVGVCTRHVFVRKGISFGRHERTRFAYYDKFNGKAFASKARKWADGARHTNTNTHPNCDDDP